MPVFEDVQKEELLFRETEAHKNEKAYTIRAIVASGTTVPILFIPPDGDFLITALCGAMQGPVNVNGLRQFASATDFPRAGTTTGYADRGLQIILTHTSQNGRKIIREQAQMNPGVAMTRDYDFLPVECLLTPGYGFTDFYKPQPFMYFVPKGEYLQFSVRNYDLAAGLFHRLDMAIIGKRYLG